MTRSERVVAKFLRELEILWSYEKPIYVRDKNKRPRVWTPDFFWFSLIFMLRFVDPKILIMNIEE